MIGFMSIGGKRNWDWANIKRVCHVKPGRELNGKLKKILFRTTGKFI